MVLFYYVKPFSLQHTVPSLSKMPTAKRLSKADRLFEKALFAINKNNVTMRVAALIARLPPSTFYRRLMNHNQPTARGTYLNMDEEGVIVQLVNHYSSQGFPLNREDMGDAVQTLVNSLPIDRQKKNFHYWSTW